MPILKSSKKKMRRDIKAQARNNNRRKALKDLVKVARRNSSKENLQAVFSGLDKAAKLNIIHKNKAARLKSRLSKAVAPAPAPKTKTPKAQATA